jgi:hypothetical protein
LTRVSLSKGKDAIDLDAPLATSAGRPISNKTAKAASADAAATKKTQASITQCLAEVSSTLIFREKKNRRKVSDATQEENIEDGAQETQGGLLPVDRVDSRNVSPDASGAKLLQRQDPQRHRSQNVHNIVVVYCCLLINYLSHEKFTIFVSRIVIFLL